jgi:hypothetical protein
MTVFGIVYAHLGLYYMSLFNHDQIITKGSCFQRFITICICLCFFIF